MRGAGPVKTTTGSRPPGAGHAYYRRKLSGKTEKEAIRALKRKISDAIYRQLVEDAEAQRGPSGQVGTTPKLRPA